jgi:hypothetical protein
MNQDIEAILARIATIQEETAIIQAQTAAYQREAEHWRAEYERQHAATERQLAETSREVKATGRQIRELKIQLGGLGNKFGSFTEGLALPSMTKILTHLGATFVAPRVRIRRNGTTIELDVFAYANQGANKAWVVEVKSHVRDEHLAELLGTLRRFPDFFPEHADKELYGILAGVDIPEDLPACAVAAGVYLARIRDDTFQLISPPGFVPKSFKAG